MTIKNDAPENPQILLVSTKADVPDPKISSDEAEKVRVEIAAMTYIATSSINGIGIGELTSAIADLILKSATDTSSSELPLTNSSVQSTNPIDCC
jgi:selenocysteine-specific translation elongation factor